MILLTVFLRLQNKKCDNFFFYVIGTNRDFPIIDVLYTNCVHLFIDLRTKNDFLHFFGSRDFFFCVARNSAWSRAAFENRHYKLISRHFELFYNEHMCLVMNAHTHTHTMSYIIGITAQCFQWQRQEKMGETDKIFTVKNDSKAKFGNSTNVPLISHLYFGLHRCENYERRSKVKKFYARCKWFPFVFYDLSNKVILMLDEFEFV